MLVKSFAYSRKSFSMDFIIISMSAIIIIALLAFTANLDTLSIIAGVLVVAVVLLVLGVSPLLTEHQILGDKIVLRQGWYFKAEIPIKNIKRIEMVERGPLRTGVFFRLFQSTLFVTSKRYDLIMLELKEKRRFGWALGKKADKIMFDVLKSERFLRAIEDIRTSLSPIQS
jgi:membrane protein YdbS with pleckstrin-like domain